MKKILLALATLYIFMFVGCGDNDTNKPVSSIVIGDIFKTSHFSASEKHIIVSQLQWQELIDDLNNTATSLSTMASGNAEVVYHWVSILEKTNIDFTKENILVFTDTVGGGCIVEDTITLNNDNKEAKIVINSINTTCTTAVTLYYLAYKVSKEVETIDVKVLGNDPVRIENIEQ